MLGLEANVDNPRERCRNCDGANRRVLNNILVELAEEA